MSVTDNTSANSTVTGDFDGTSNYSYDAIGNLISDTREQIAEIIWTVSGKVKEVIRTGNEIEPVGSGEYGSDMVFEYDAMGNRVSKLIKYRDATGLTGVTKTTFYIRDASGNVMATYTEDYDGSTTVQRLGDFNIYGSL